MLPAHHTSPAPDARRLALCADDFGLHPGINHAAIALASAGRITAISGMVAAPAWQHQHTALRELDRTRIDIGLHLDLTEYTISAQKRQSLPALIFAACTSTLAVQSVHDEINAQLDAFESALGRAPSHIDGHRHVQQLPTIRDALIDILQQRYPTQRPWMRVSLPAHACADGLTSRVKSRLLGQLGGRRLRQLAQVRQLPHNARLLGVYGFGADAVRYRHLLACWLRDARSGDLLMCHPAIECDEPNDPIATARRCEYDILASSTFTDLLAEHAISLAPMSRILADLNPCSPAIPAQHSQQLSAHQKNTFKNKYLQSNAEPPPPRL